MVVAAPDETATVSAPVDASFEDTPVTATVSPVPEAASATADAGFDGLGVTPAPPLQGRRWANTLGDTGVDENEDTDLYARVAALLQR
jgi:hypothetical protein